MPELIQIVPKTDGLAQVQMTFLSEGYTINERQKFIDDVTFLFNFVVNHPIWAEYKNRWHCLGVWEPSNESGCDRPNVGIYRDTVFNAINENDRYLHLDGVGRSKAMTYSYQYAFPLNQNNLTIVLVNDNTYGGSGGNYYLTCSLHSLSTEILIHEIGHTFANLWDEYDFGYNGTAAKYYGTINLSDTGDPLTVRWNKYILNSEVGNPFQQGSDWWTPKDNCIMRNLGVPHCPICKHTLIDKLKDMVGIIDDYPKPNSISISIQKN